MHDHGREAELQAGAAVRVDFDLSCDGVPDLKAVDDRQPVLRVLLNHGC